MENLQQWGNANNPETLLMYDPAATAINASNSVETLQKLKDFARTLEKYVDLLGKKSREKAKAFTCDRKSVVSIGELSKEELEQSFKDHQKKDNKKRIIIDPMIENKKARRKIEENLENFAGIPQTQNDRKRTITDLTEDEKVERNQPRFHRTIHRTRKCKENYLKISEENISNSDIREQRLFINKHYARENHDEDERINFHSCEELNKGKRNKSDHESRNFLKEECGSYLSPDDEWEYILGGKIPNSPLQCSSSKELGRETDLLYSVRGKGKTLIADNKDERRTEDKIRQVTPIHQVRKEDTKNGSKEGTTTDLKECEEVRKRIEAKFENATVIIQPSKEKSVIIDLTEEDEVELLQTCRKKINKEKGSFSDDDRTYLLSREGSFEKDGSLLSLNISQENSILSGKVNDVPLQIEFTQQNQILDVKNRSPSPDIGEETKLRYSIGHNRKTLNVNISELGLTAMFGQSVVSSRDKIVSHITLSDKWNYLPRDPREVLKYYLGEGPRRLSLASSLDPSINKQKLCGIPVFWCCLRNSKCHYIGHYRCVEFTRGLQNCVEKGRKRQALINFQHVKFDEVLAEKLSNIPA